MSQVLSETAARSRVDPSEWKKGESYARGLTNLSVRPAGQGREFRAVAHGREPYRVSVTVQGGKVVGSACSCPVGGGGCKHVAALLNKLSGTPEQDFIPLPALDDLLAELEAPALRRLVERMLAREPELETLVYAQTGRSVPTGDLQARLNAAFNAMTASYNHYEQWDSEDGPDTEAIDALLEELDQRRAKLPDIDETETEALASAYVSVLDGVDAFYERHDIDYGLDDVQEEGLLGLYDLFVNAELEGDVRKDALETVRNEIATHRASFDRDEFFDFYSVLTGDEQQEIFSLIEALSRKGEGYQRKRYLAALLELRGGEASDEDTEALLRTEYNPTGLIVFLLERGRVTEAVQALPKHRIPFASLRPAFEKANALPLLEEAALKVQSWDKQDALLWLHDLYRETKREQQATALAREQAQDSPSAGWFTRLKQFSPDWVNDRDEIIRKLWTKEQVRHELLRLLVDEGLADQAYALLDNEERSARGLLLVARLPELDAQRAALLYLRAGKVLIVPRGRSAYAQAADVLKELIPRVGLEEAKTLVATHFPERQRLPALREELHKVGLL